MLSITLIFSKSLFCLTLKGVKSPQVAYSKSHVFWDSLYIFSIEKERKGGTYFSNKIFKSHYCLPLLPRF